MKKDGVNREVAMIFIAPIKNDKCIQNIWLITNNYKQLTKKKVDTIIIINHHKTTITLQG